MNRTVSIERLLAKLGIAPSEAGFVKCPRHKDDHPSLKIYGKKSRIPYTWYCFECRRGGGAVEFLAYKSKISFRNAALSIAKHFKVTPIGFSLDLPSAKKTSQRKEKLHCEAQQGAERRLCGAFLSRIRRIEPEGLRVFVYECWFNFAPDYLDRSRYGWYNLNVAETELREFILGSIETWRKHNQPESCPSQLCKSST